MSHRVQAIGPAGFGIYELDGEVLTPSSGDTELTYTPGFVDIHIHGGFGTDFMSASASEMLTLCGRLASLGYEGLLPTTVTARAEAVAGALSNLPDDPMILGFHLEGPFISSVYPGAQPKEYIAPAPDGPSSWDAILDDVRLKAITIAPEIPGAIGLIQRLSQRGVSVGIGHTNATHTEAKAGFEAGANRTTHTFNAMRPLHHREAGTVGFALSEPRLAAELIYDRLHVSPEAARLLIRSKPPEGLIAVSDGTAAAGMPNGSRLTMWGHEAIVGSGDVRLPDGTLAGSAITLLDAFRNLRDDFGAEVAIRATSLNPRNLLGLGDPRVTLLIDGKGEIAEIRRQS